MMRVRCAIGAVLLMALAAACGTHDTPTTSSPAQDTRLTVNSPRLSGGYVTSFIECVVTANPAQPSAVCSSGSQPYKSTSRSALLTQQCVVACAEPWSPTYDARHGWFVVQLRVRGMSYQALGTVDGVTASPWKTSVVLVENPRSLEGLGTVSVVGPTTRISAHPQLPANTLYATYPGIIRGGQLSDARPWTFQVPPSVRKFAFRVVVVADVQARVKIMEVMPGTRTGKVPTGAWLEMDNVGSASIWRTTLYVVDSILETKSVVVASMPINDDWATRERRIVASADLVPVFFTPVYGRFPSQYVFDPNRTHHVRVMAGGRYGKVLDELMIYPRTVALSGVSFERAYTDTGGSSSKLFYPAWTGSTTPIQTRCAGVASCPVLKGTPGIQ